MSGKLVQVGDKACAEFDVNGEKVVVEDWCTHRGGPLSEGTLENAIVTCPWHGSQFDLKSCGVLKGPATRGLKKVETSAE